MLMLTLLLGTGRALDHVATPRHYVLPIGQTLGLQSAGFVGAHDAGGDARGGGKEFYGPRAPGCHGGRSS
ncbi:MAG: hypothetical protein U0Q12_19865 [Vicinamibacterales bacterium]